MCGSRRPEGGGEYLRRVVCPLTIHIELVLMLSFWQVQDGYKVVMAARKRKKRFQLSGLPSELT